MISNTFPPSASGGSSGGLTGAEVPAYEINYVEVNTYADLPAASTTPNDTYIVRTSTGTWLLGTLKKAGLYYSNGVAWSYMGNSISIDDSSTSNESVWSSGKTNTMLGGKSDTSHSHTVNSLSDTTITNLANGQVLSYDIVTSKWMNSTPTTGTTDHTLLNNIGINTHAQIDTALGRLANTSGTNTGDEDVSSIKTKLGITTLSGSNTGDQDLSGLSLNTHNHTVDSLSNVVITANSDNEVLAWDSTISKWTNQTATEAGLASDTHNHTGVYEPADATILKSAAIGATVQAYDANMAKLNVAQTFTNAQRGSINTITYGATITPDFAASNNFICTLTGNVVMANPTNIVAGQYGKITLIQDATGTRTVGYGTYFKFAGGTTPTLITTANSKTTYYYEVASATEIVITSVSDWK